jgi:hypothetical protein
VAKEPLATRGHFEVYRGEAERLIGESSGAIGWLWRFVDQNGKHTAHSESAFDTPGEAKLDVARFVGQVRQATYGQRFDAEIADAVVEVDL